MRKMSEVAASSSLSSLLQNDSDIDKVSHKSCILSSAPATQMSQSFPEKV